MKTLPINYYPHLLLGQIYIHIYTYVHLYIYIFFSFPFTVYVLYHKFYETL